MKILSDVEIETISGGLDGRDTGRGLAIMYWGARNYLADTVYPFWLG